MNTSTNFDAALSCFLNAAQKKVDQWDMQFPNQPRTRLEVEHGPKYVRVVRTNGSTSRAVYCFIDKETGRIWKAKSWSAAEKKNPRSCIYNTDHGASGVNWHGAVYLR